MSLLLSLFFREFNFKPRQKWFYLKRVIFVAFSGVVILVVFTQQLFEQSTKAGLVMFEWLSMIVILSACFVSPYMSCSTIVNEKENRTFGLLLLSDISIWQLVCGKLITSICGAMFTLMAVLPMFTLCISLGGIDFSQVLLAFPVILSLIWLGAILGLFLSAFTRTEVSMQGWIIALALIVFGVLPIIVYLISAFYQWPVTEIMTVISSPCAIFIIKLGETNAGYDLILWNCLFNFCIGLPLIPLTVYFLPRQHFKPPGKSFKERLKSIFKHPSPPPNLKNPPILGNPVTWKDLHIHYGGERSSWLKSLGSMGGLCLLISIVYYIILILPGSKKSFELLFLLKINTLTVAILSGLNFIYGTISRAAQTCNREKQDRTLELMLTTDISSYDIVMGKSNAISLTLMPWIMGFGISCLSFLFISIMDGMAIPTIFIICGIMLNLVCMVFAYEYIAIYYSLKVTSHATATSLAGFVTWYVVGNAILFLLAAIFALPSLFLSFFAFPVVGPIIMGNHYRMKTIENFTGLVMHQLPQK